jgi:hypothetical protein
MVAKGDAGISLLGRSRRMGMPFLVASGSEENVGSAATGPATVINAIATTIICLPSFVLSLGLL